MEYNNFFERHKLPKLKQEEIDILNSSIRIEEIEFVILKIYHRETTDTDGFLEEFYKIFKNTNPIQTLSENRKRRNTPQVILECQHCPNTKIRTRQCNKTPDHCPL